MAREWEPSSPGFAGFMKPRLGFPNRAGPYRPGGPPFSSPVRWGCTCMEGFYDPGMEPSPGGAGSTNPRLGFHTVQGGIDPDITVFVPGLLVIGRME